MLRLQHQYQDIKIKGLNLAVSGDVPIAAGLSSSSTIVVGTLQAAIALNNFKLTSQQFIDLCGTLRTGGFPYTSRRISATLV